MKYWLKEPLFHFLLIGTAIFFLYGWVAGADRFRSNEMKVTSAKHKNLALAFSPTRQRPPTQSELDGMIKDFIQEERSFTQYSAEDLNVNVCSYR